MATGNAKRRIVVLGCVALGAALVFMVGSGACKKKETASEQAGRQAREAYEKSKVLLKEGVDKTADLTKEGLQKGSDAAKQGYEKSKEAAKEFQKGWTEGGKK